MSDSRYPIGPFVLPETFSSLDLAQWIGEIETEAASYRLLTEKLTDAQLDKTYRDGSWNVRQLVHHVADIQFLHYLRMKKALTEPDRGDTTLINMDGWAMLPDSVTDPIAGSLQSLEGVTQRYVSLARGLTEAQLALTYFHPLRKIWFNQGQALAMSSWHLRHHLAHIRIALSRN